MVPDQIFPQWHKRQFRKCWTFGCFPCFLFFHHCELPRLPARLGLIHQRYPSAEQQLTTQIQTQSNNTITNTSTNMHVLEFDSFMNVLDVLQSIQWDVNMRAWVKQDTLDVTFVRDKWIHLILQNELIDKWPGFFDPAGQVWRVSEPCPYFACEHFSSTPSARPPRPLLSLTPQFIRFERNIERALKLMYPVNGIRSQPAFSKPYRFWYISAQSACWRQIGVIL